MQENKKWAIPTGSIEQYLPLYRHLYKKYYGKHILEKGETEGGKRMKARKQINSIDHFEYFLVEEGWRAMKELLDRPIIESAKYEVGQKIKFIKEKWIPKGTPINQTVEEAKSNVECTGVITEIYTSGIGNCEIFYGIKELTPECWECNPFASEKNVLEVINQTQN